MSVFYEGQSITQTIEDNLGERYFYGLRRTDSGELFLGKLDQLSLTDTIQINKEGEPKNLSLVVVVATFYTDFNNQENKKMRHRLHRPRQHRLSHTARLQGNACASASNLFQDQAGSSVRPAPGVVLSFRLQQQRAYLSSFTRSEANRAAAQGATAAHTSINNNVPDGLELVLAGYDLTEVDAEALHRSKTKTKATSSSSSRSSYR